MEIKTVRQNGTVIALVHSGELLIHDGPSALDLMMSVKYETDSHRLALNKAAITEDFFRLSTGLAGEVLQKFTNYRIKFAIIGDFSGYTSKPLQDFIYECNHGNSVFFVGTEEEAVQKLSLAE